MTMIFRQFNNKDYQHFNMLFVAKDKHDQSRAKNSTNLFGWGEERFMRQFVSAFTLEIVYDKT